MGAGLVGQRFLAPAFTAHGFSKKERQAVRALQMPG